MTEYDFGTFGSMALTVAVLASVFYWLGGRAGKWKRRFLAPAILVGGSSLLALLLDRLNGIMLLSYPLMATALSLGYGGDDEIIVIWRRTLFSSAVVIAGVPIVYSIGGYAWVLLVVQAIIGIGGTRLLATRPIFPAAIEEGVIGFLLFLFVPLYPLIR